MDVKDFYYELPQELIAQDPLEDRSSSRLLVLHKEDGRMEHTDFKHISEYLNPGDCLVLNNTKVIPARLFGEREGTQAKIEVLLLKRKENDVWETLVRPGKKAKPGTRILFGGGLLAGEVLEIVEDGNRLIKFTYEGIFEEILDRLGQMPLPPYITHQLQDKNRYQTVYAKEEGSAAAPTAGLHFTPELLEEIRAKGISIAEVTLHVGLGTFRPVKVAPDGRNCSQNHQRRQTKGRAGGLRGDHKLPYSGICGNGPAGGKGAGTCHLQGRGCGAARKRLDRYFYIPWVSVPGIGRADYKFPFARVHAGDAGVCICWQGACAGRLPGCGRGAVSVF